MAASDRCPRAFFRCWVFRIWFALFLILPSTAVALAPEQILVIANRNAAKSVDLARYYMEKRGIPETNLLRLWTTDAETCSRYDYLKKIAGPTRKFIRTNG